MYRERERGREKEREREQDKSGKARKAIIRAYHLNIMHGKEHMGKRSDNDYHQLEHVAHTQVIVCGLCKNYLKNPVSTCCRITRVKAPAKVYLSVVLFCRVEETRRLLSIRRTIYITLNSAAETADKSTTSCRCRVHIIRSKPQ